MAQRGKTVQVQMQQMKKALVDIATLKEKVPLDYNSLEVNLVPHSAKDVLKQLLKTLSKLMRSQKIDGHIISPLN